MNENFQHSHRYLLERTYNADRTQKINSDCAEKDSENVPFGEGRKKAQKLKLIRYKSAHNNGDEEDEAEKLWWGIVNGKNRNRMRED